jgi:hypothetical protein
MSMALLYMELYVECLCYVSFNARKFCHFCETSNGESKFLKSDYMLCSQTSYDNSVS